MSFSDCSYMRRALELAKKARFNCPPNPAVGCVIVKDRRIIGEGFTQKTGEAHAEVMALRDAASRGESVAGATVYVTLEPCSHYGRTPPCALALKNAKVARVVAALKDPNPLVAGKGLKMLEEAGVKVECGLEAEEAEEINRGFLKRQREGMPWVQDGHERGRQYSACQRQEPVDYFRRSPRGRTLLARYQRSSADRARYGAGG